MQARKKKKKAGRRAQKHMDAAWEAVEAENLSIACKEARRATDERNDNPVMWNDYGLILSLADANDEAEKALRNAILIAPAYAEAYANLARLVARLGRPLQAARLIREAAALEPARYASQMRAYEALVPRDDAVENKEPPLAADEPDAQEALGASRLERYAWQRIGENLDWKGCAALPGLVSPGHCDEIVALSERDDLFEKTVELQGGAGHGGNYRFFRKPLPAIVRELRAAIYEKLVLIANSRQELLGEEGTFPPSHSEFLRACAEQGQSRSTPILLHYRGPAVNDLHRDVWGRITFPYQLAVTLRRRGALADEAREEGSFILADEATGKKAGRMVMPLDEGDGVVFCTRHRLERVGDAIGLQSVAHGMTPMTTGERFVLGCPFHDYK